MLHRHYSNVSAAETLKLHLKIDAVTTVTVVADNTGNRTYIKIYVGSGCWFASLLLHEALTQTTIY